MCSTWGIVDYMQFCTATVVFACNEFVDSNFSETSLLQLCRNLMLPFKKNEPKVRASISAFCVARVVTDHRASLLRALCMSYDFVQRSQSNAGAFLSINHAVLLYFVLRSEMFTNNDSATWAAAFMETYLKNAQANIMDASLHIIESASLFSSNTRPMFVNLQTTGWQRATENLHLVASATAILQLRHDKRHVLLCGPPGCGKTALATAVAHQFSNCTTVVIDGAHWDYMAGLQNAGQETFRFFIRQMNDMLTSCGVTDTMQQDTHTSTAPRACALLVIIKNPEYFVNESYGDGEDKIAYSTALNRLFSLVNVSVILLAQSTLQNPFASIAPDIVNRYLTLVSLSGMSQDATRRILRANWPSLSDNCINCLVAQSTLHTAISNPKCAIIAARHLIATKSAYCSPTQISLQNVYCDDDKLLNAMKTFFCNNIEDASTLTEEDVTAYFKKISVSPPETALFSTATMCQRLQLLHRRASEEFVGQQDAISVVINSLTEQIVGRLPDSREVYGSFLFTGSTGVGKTSFARLVAEVLFDNVGLLEINMCSFKDDHQISQLIGSAPGLVMSSKPSVFAEAIARGPLRVVIVDEFDKAKRDVMDIFLTAIDESAQLTDASNTRISFDKAIVFFISNIGQATLLDYRAGLRVNWTDTVQTVHAELQNHMRPEFLSRVSEIVVFQPMMPQIIKTLALNILEHLAASYKKRNVHLQWSGDVVNYLVGHQDLSAGARGYKKRVTKLVQQTLVKNLYPALSKQLTVNALLIVHDDTLIASEIVDEFTHVDNVE